MERYMLVAYGQWIDNVLLRVRKEVRQSFPAIFVASNPLGCLQPYLPANSYANLLNLNNNKYIFLWYD